MWTDETLHRFLWSAQSLSKRLTSTKAPKLKGIAKIGPSRAKPENVFVDFHLSIPIVWNPFVCLSTCWTTRLKDIGVHKFFVHVFAKIDIFRRIIIMWTSIGQVQKKWCR